MAVLTAKDRAIGMEIKKKIGKHSTYGYCKYGGYFYGHGYKVHGIYQVRHRYGHITPIIMKFYKPPETALRIANPKRATFADGMLAWSNLTNSQKSEYKNRAKIKVMHGVNLFMREYMLSH